MRLRSQEDVPITTGDLPQRESSASTKKRSGLPYEDTFNQDKQYLFIPNLHRDHMPSTVTSFFVLQSFYTAFFGTTPQLGHILPRALTPSSISSADSSEIESTQSEADDISLPRQESGKKRANELPSHQAVKRQGRLWASTAEVNSPVHSPARHTIHFRTFRYGQLETVRTAHVDPSDENEVKKVAYELQEQDFAFLSTSFKSLLPEQVQGSALSSGINTVLVLPRERVVVDKPLKQAIKNLLQSDSKSVSV
ncbi:uncharacterized protein B0I36DRAFT_397157 [Microdochium trichocladiopsis]|uniref:Uncharacterized protein n=1 Tax=Microdochium trichocladiopsis TaxID=1682393 RepID=A0A9P8XV50_9PEZI|nr:uncharacterized protein B0I36DRAFT_397157 [Microdochium trichocladiopsis]KAH7016529.1 hypothetical protein B0I36DRAFT_397157 [Microdochium trichocladiopsis]